MTTRINHHPDEATLMAYAAGSLGEAPSVVVAGHLALCPDCRTAVRHAEELGGTLIEELDGAPLSEKMFERVMAALDRAEAAAPRETQPSPCDPDLPPELFRRLGCPMSDVRWRRIAPRMQVYDLPLSPGACGRLRLVKIGKGGRVREHGHSGSELTLVLKGSYVDHLGRFAAGDVADLDPEVEHRIEVDSDEPCVCLVALESPVRFKGIIARLMQPFTGF